MVEGIVLPIAVAFAVVNGANDGAALVGSALKAPGVRPLTGVLVVTIAVVVVPVVLGVGVARTLASGVVSAPDHEAQLLAVAAVAAVVVVGALAAMGLPSSLTLAVVGGLVGAGVSLELPVRWPTVGLVLAAGAASPVLGGWLGRLLARVPLWRLRPGPAIGWWHRVGFAGQALAYAANDGQKMVAVVLAGSAAGAAGGGRPSLALLGALGAGFGVGTLVALRPLAATLESRVLNAGPSDEVVAEMASAVAVLAAAGVAAPVSMTQAVSGALIGTGTQRGRRRVRWRAAARLALAWTLTLPAGTLVGGVVALLVEGM